MDEAAKCVRWLRFLGNGGAPTYRALVSACRPTPTILNSSLGFKRGKRGFLAQNRTGLLDPNPDRNLKQTLT